MRQHLVDVAHVRDFGVESAPAFHASLDTFLRLGGEIERTPRQRRIGVIPDFRSLDDAVHIDRSITRGLVTLRLSQRRLVFVEDFLVRNHSSHSHNVAAHATRG